VSDGDEARKNAYKKGMKIINGVHKALDLISDNKLFNDKRRAFKKLAANAGKKINTPSTSYPILTNNEIDNKIIELGNYKWLNEDRFIRYLSIDPTKTAKENWNNIGRGICHKDYLMTGETNFRQQLQDIENGSVNCTIWAELIHWFLVENGYPAFIVNEFDHTFVMSATRDGKKIELTRIAVYADDAKTLDDIEFGVHDLWGQVEKNKLDVAWKGVWFR